MAGSAVVKKRDGETAMHCLDRAVHPGTGDDEALASINAFRKLTEGSTVTYICEQLFGEALDLLVLEDEWEQKFAEQAALIKRLNAENNRLKRLDGSAQPKQQPPRPVITMSSADENLSDDEWAAVEPVLPMRYRNDMIRHRIAAMWWALNVGTWRALTPESESKWTTFYNMHRAWERSGLWQKVERALG